LCYTRYMKYIMQKFLILFIIFILMLETCISYAGETKDIDKNSTDEISKFEYVIESLIMNKEYSKACFMAYELTRRYPQVPKGYFLLAKARYKSGQEEGAIYAYADCIRVDPKYYQAYFNRGVIYDKQKKYIQAIRDYTYVIHHDDIAVPYAYLNRGVDKYYMGKYKEALRDYNKILKTFPKFDLMHKVYYHRGMAQYALGNYEDSVQDYEKAKELNPNYNYVYYDLLK